MLNQNNVIHANAVFFNNKGFLIIGNSGSGKSDLTLRLIDGGGVLISDDYTVLDIHNDNQLWAICPDKLEGLLEIRGLGIIQIPFIKMHRIDCVIECVPNYPRLPDNVYFEHHHVQIKKILLNPFEISVLNKIKHIDDIILL